MTMPVHGHQLYRRVQQAAQGTPYAVTETDKGFDVTLDIVNADWYGLFNKAGLKKVYVHHVAFPEPGVYTITDDSRTVDWVAGVPRTGGSVERKIGRFHEVGFQKVYAFDEHGEFGLQADYRFTSEEGRGLITRAADAEGLGQRRGNAEKAGITMAVITAVGFAVALIVVLVLWLTGAFG
jgi:hypothetical protein